MTSIEVKARMTDTVRGWIDDARIVADAESIAAVCEDEIEAWVTVANRPGSRLVGVDEEGGNVIRDDFGRLHSPDGLTFYELTSNGCYSPRREGAAK